MKLCSKLTNKPAVLDSLYSFLLEIAMFWYWMDHVNNVDTWLYTLTYFHPWDILGSDVSIPGTPLESPGIPGTFQGHPPDEDLRLRVAHRGALQQNLHLLLR